MFILLVALVVGAELYCRHQLGLGDPPLMMTDPTIEYLYQPSKTYQRFGNTIAINRWSMRSDDLPETKSDPDELRILIIGDSIVNGGSLSDQSTLATEIIQRELATRLKRPVVVGNASAGSWGPLNMLAYVRKFGFFDADVVIFVLSSHDWNDVPTFAPLSDDMPTHGPALALQEAVTRYLPRYLPTSLGGTDDAAASQPAEAEPGDPDVAKSLAAVAEMVQLALASGAKVAMAEHLERNETMDRLLPGHTPIADAAKQAGANVIQLGPSFAQAAKAGIQAYRDHIHPNDAGQRIIAQTLMDWIVAMTRDNNVDRSPQP